MPEVVVAYAGADEDAADRVIKKLEKLGYKVTRNEAGPRSARRTTPRKPAPPVLLLWSRAFARSSLPPKRPLAMLRLDAAPPPPMVKAPAIDLRAWRGREDHRGWRKLIGALAPKGASAKGASNKRASLKSVGAARKSTTAAKATTKMTNLPKGGGTPSKKSTRIDALIFLVFLALAGGGAYYALFLHK
jgi:hypothetical protein